MQHRQPDPSAPAVDHYVDRSWNLINLLPDADTAEEYTRLLAAIGIIERATDAEIHDPDPIDLEVGLHEPNWLARLD